MFLITGKRIVASSIFKARRESYMESIYVLGASTNGIDIALVCAQSGFDVVLYDANKMKLIDAIDRLDKILEISINKELISLQQKNMIMGRVDVSNDLYTAKHSSLVLGVVVEGNEKDKISMFRKLDLICGSEIVFVIDNSSQFISTIANATSRAEKIVGLRFYNPILTMKVIGIIKCKYTSESIYNKILNFVKRLDRTPVEIVESSKTFQNAMLIPMLNDAIEYLLDVVPNKIDMNIFEKMYQTYSIRPFALSHLVEDLEDN